MFNDRLMTGAIAGITGAVVQNIYAFIAKSTGLQGPTYVDYGKILLFNKYQPGLLASTMGLLGHLIWDIILGVVFAYIISNTTSRYYLLKGILFGMAVWFLIKLGTTMFKIPIINDVLPLTVAFFFFGAILYGLATAFALRYLDSMNTISEASLD